jgi:chemotaxis signal transduction protein
VLSPARSELSDKPEVQTSKSSEYITHVYRRENSLILLLDIARALGVEDINTAVQSQKKAA